LSIKKSPKKGAFFTIIIVDTGEGNIKKYAIDFIDKYLGFFCCFMGKVQCPSFSGQGLPSLAFPSTHWAESP